MEERKTETKEQINKRLETAKSELKAIKNNALFNIQVVNDNLRNATFDLQKQLANYYPQIKAPVGSSS